VGGDRPDRGRRADGVADLSARAGVAAALAVAVAAPFLLTGLGAAPFDDPGEGMHAEIARELTVSGDVLRLTLNGVRYVDKPPLLYTLMAGVFAALGPSEGTARLVPAVAALAAVGATAWLGARLLGAASGLVAGLALATCTGFFAYGRYVRPETLFVAALAGGFALALTGLVEGRRRRVVGGLAVFGLAALAKDPLGALAPPLAIGVALALGGRARPVSRWLPWPGATAALGLGFGWYALVELTTPGFLWYTVVDNHVLNVARARHFPDEDVPLTALQFLAVASMAAVPWVAPAAAATWRLVRARAWRDPREMPWIALALWAVGVLGITALSPFRLPHYGLPAYPALALLAARGWHELGAARLAAVHAVVFAALAAACGAAWASDGAVFMTDVMGATDVATRTGAAAGAEAPLPPWPALRALLGTAALVFGAGAVATAAAARRCAGRAVWGVLATLLALMPVVTQGLGLVASHRSVRDLAREVAARGGGQDLVAHEGPIESSAALEWYGTARPVIVDGRRSVLGFGATRADGAGAFWDVERLRQAWLGERRVWLVSVRPPADSVAAGLPGATLVRQSGGRRLYVNR